MRALLVDPSNYTPYYDYSLCKALRQIGCEAELVTSPFLYDDLPNPDGLPIHYFFYRGFRLPLLSRLPFTRAPELRKALKALEYPFDLLTLVQHLKAHKPDVLHLQWAVFPPFDRLLFRQVKAWGIKLVYTVHEPPPADAARRRRRAYAALCQAADQIIVPSEWGKLQLVKGLALDPARVHVIPLGNLDDFRGQVLRPEQAKKTMGIDPSESTVLFFGRIMPRKGLEVIIRAFPMVKEMIPEAKLLIAGHPVESFSRYERLIVQVGAARDIIVHLGFVPQKDLTTYFCAADVVALPYIQAYHSALLHTAYTYGRPVVTTATGGLPEDVEEGRSGFVVPPRNEKALAEAIATLLADVQKRKEMGRYARHLAETRHAWPRIAKATLEVYRSVLSK